MNRLIVLFIYLLVFSVSAQSRKPNIIYILTDDLGIGDVKAFNKNSKIATPHLDKMASEGMIFTDAHTASSVCTPTRYGIVTGRYAWRSHLKSKVIFGNSKALVRDNRATIGTIAKKNGYKTAFIGKSHLGWNWGMKGNQKNEGYWEGKKSSIPEDQIDFSKPVTHTPNSIGFDYHYGTCASLDMSPYVYITQGQPTETEMIITNGADWRRGVTAHNFKHEDVLPFYVDHSIEYIQKNAKGDKPFLLYMPLPAPHTPIVPKQQWKGKSGLNAYADFVIMIDDYMGKLFKSIKNAGIEENTLVIFTSDNGCSPRAKYSQLLVKGHNPSAQFRGTKSDIWEGGHRVPFIAKWPAKIKAGTTCDATICTNDLMATIADINGYNLKDNEGEDSYSILPLFEQKDTNYKREATVHHSVVGKYAIRKGDWKLIFTNDSGGWSKVGTDFSKMMGGDAIDLEHEGASHGEKSKSKGKKKKGKSAKGKKGKSPKGKKAIGPNKTQYVYQLYNMKYDEGERNDLYAKHPEIVEELKALMVKYVKDGRSTPGEKQTNEGGNHSTWQGVNFMGGNSSTSKKRKK